MSAKINYKSKYLELRSKYINDIDMAFRLGAEQGMQQAQQQQALDAQAKMQEAEMRQREMEANGMGGQPGQPGQEDDQPPQDGSAPGEEGGQPPQMAGQAPSELDQHISKLESALGSNPSPEIKKSLDVIISLRKAERQAVDMKKAEEAIKGIVKALHKPTFKIGVQASHNLTDNAKKAVSLQHKIVNDVMKAWENEKDSSKKEIETILKVDGLLGE